MNGVMEIDQMDSDQQHKDKVNQMREYMHVDEDGYVEFKYDPLTKEEYEAQFRPNPYVQPDNRLLDGSMPERNWRTNIPNQLIGGKDIDRDTLYKKLSQYRYDENETVNDVNRRVEKAMDRAERGYFKKADDA